MALLELTDIEFNYSDKELYRKANMKVNLGEHCCLVGINGCGKTTILSMIVGEITPDAGKVSWTNGVTYSYLDQQLKVQQDMPVEDYLYGVYKDLFAKERQMEQLYEKAAYSNDFEKILAKAQRLQDELEQADFYSLQEKVGRISDGLGFDRTHLDMPLHELSGGQREKAYIAKMLLEEKDVLIMDEPTNFLDQSQVAWLASYLNSYPNAFLVVSHDQEFLKKIANVVFVLENGTITRYKGDFEHYLIQHEIDKEQYQKNYEAQQRYIKKEEEFIAKHIVRATSAKAAKSHRARLAHLDVMDAPAKDEGNIRFSFPFTHDVGEKPLIVEELSIGYKGKPLLDPISFILLKGEKIAILGQNGVGKTTFLKTILEIIPSIDGEFRWLDGTVINYYGQDEKIDLSLTPFQYIHNIYPELNNTQIRTALGNCGVRKDLALRSMSELSGGEVTKTRFAAMTLKKANFLVLDEPTNHLDQKAKDALFDAIERFPGAVIIVSHEKDFYDGLVDYELNF
ncbi:MAG: ATP-binding cassette domain-containing protein [Bacilli bacterium]|nr:ATP-binding cassette domain-containing protein [Bacilli bacterium]